MKRLILYCAVSLFSLHSFAMHPDNLSDDFAMLFTQLSFIPGSQRVTKKAIRVKKYLQQHDIRKAQERADQLLQEAARQLPFIDEHSQAALVLCARIKKSVVGKQERTTSRRRNKRSDPEKMTVKSAYTIREVMPGPLGDSPPLATTPRSLRSSPLRKVYSPRDDKD